MKSITINKINQPTDGGPFDVRNRQVKNGEDDVFDYILEDYGSWLMKFD